MTKLHKTATALLLTAAMLLTGCAERSNVPAPGSDTNTNTSTDISDSNSSESTDNSSESSISSDNSTPTTSESSSSDTSDSVSGSESSTESDSNSEVSSDISADTVPVEFTEEDRELQKILADLEGNLEAVSAWGTSSGMTYNTAEHVFMITNVKHANHYYPIPDNFLIGGMILPNTYEDMREMLLENFSEQFTDNYMKRMAAKGSLKEGANGIPEVTIDAEDVGALKYIDIDGTLYQDNSAGGKGLSSM